LFCSLLLSNAIRSRRAGFAARLIETPFVESPRPLSARCVEDGQVAYLAMSGNAVRNWPGVVDIKGDLIINSKLLPDWGLRVVNVNLTMGNLPDVVGDETRAYLAQAKKQ
jgi:hypothetical protein